MDLFAVFVTYNVTTSGSGISCKADSILQRIVKKRGKFGKYYLPNDSTNSGTSFHSSGWLSNVLGCKSFVSYAIIEVKAAEG